MRANSTVIDHLWDEWQADPNADLIWFLNYVEKYGIQVIDQEYQVIDEKKYLLAVLRYG